jgi:hypothetical protein
MDKINELLKGMQEHPNNVKFSDLCKVCDHYFGEARQKKPAIEFIRLHGLAIHGLI